MFLLNSIGNTTSSGNLTNASEWGHDGEGSDGHEEKISRRETEENQEKQRKDWRKQQSYGTGIKQQMIKGDNNCWEPSEHF